MTDKADEGKDPWHLLPWLATQRVVRVLQFGAQKYEPHAWRQVPDARRRYFNAAIRHMLKHAFGEFDDPDSSLPHLAHALCCLLFILEIELIERGAP